MNREPNEQEIAFRVSLLKEVIIFSHIDTNILNVIAHALISVELTENEELFHKGDLSKSMYIVKEGKVQVHLEDYVFATLETRDIFGEYALLDMGERSASVTSIEKTTLYKLTKEDFDRIIEQKPEIKETILKMLVLRLREQNDWEERLAVRSKEIERQKEEIELKNIELVKLNEEIVAQRDLKDRFFSIISHDLRGPVSSFQGISSIIRLYIKENRFDDLKHMSEEIDKSVYQLSTLLDNLLNWASQQQSQIPYNPEKIHVIKMVNNLFETFRSTAISKKISLNNKVDQNSEVWADYNTATTIFRNLINNALKFTPEGGSVDLGCSGNGNCNEIIVRDSGVGIPSEKLKDLFKLKDKMTTYGTKGEKGVGLGLQLVYEFTKLNKGELNVSSEEGKGTTFMVSLPKMG